MFHFSSSTSFHRHHAFSHVSSSRTSNRGAPEEWLTLQNLDICLTFVQDLSKFCPIFVQLLSMSNICQNNWNFTKFCQIFVHTLSKIFHYCPRFVYRYFLFLSLSILDKYWTKNCQIFVQVLSMKCWGLAIELLVQFVKILSIFCLM